MTPYFEYKDSEWHWKDGETSEQYDERMKKEFESVQILSDEELLQLSVEDIVRLHNINYRRLIELKGEWEQEYNNFQEGEIVEVYIFDLVPRGLHKSGKKNPTEWDEAAPGQSRSDGFIEVNVYPDYEILGIDDGHNRLKDAILAGKKYIKVKIRNVRYGYPS